VWSSPSAQLSHGVALPVLTRPLCGLRCSLRSALARPDDALALARLPNVRSPVLARPVGTRLPDARPPNTRPAPASHLQEAGDGSEVRHGATTSVAEHGARRNRRRAVGGRRPASHKDRDDNSSMDTRYPSGTSTGTIFYPWVAPVPDPNLDGYGMDIFSTRE
jgi:hypothetical protein